MQGRTEKKLYYLPLVVKPYAALCFEYLCRLHNVFRLMVVGRIAARIKIMVEAR